MRPITRFRVRRTSLTKRLCAAGLGLATVLALLPTVLGVLPGVTTVAARAEEDTISQNNGRTGWDPSATGLSPAQVSGSGFGALPGFPVQLNGQIYAQPLVVGNTVIVATENDMVYGINGSTGHVDWSRSLGQPYAITGCNNIIPNIGVTGSPVYDPGTGDVYVMAQIKPSTKPL